MGLVVGLITLVMEVVIVTECLKRLRFLTDAVTLYKQLKKNVISNLEWQVSFKCSFIKIGRCNFEI